jgi:hypothetical protein
MIRRESFVGVWRGGGAVAEWVFVDELDVVCFDMSAVSFDCGRVGQRRFMLEG